nr:MAG TPA: RteC protein [Caudoviricetes sp.]
METLIHTDFIQALSDPNVQDFCISEINSLYKGFIKSLIVLCDSIFDYKQLFRELTFAIVQLKLLYPEAAEDVTQKYITAAIALLESELHLLSERINHPALFQPPASIKGYDIHLSKRYTKHDLIELLSSVDCADVFVDSKGDVIPFSKLTALFEDLLDIKLSNPFNKRAKVLDRKIKTTKFLRVLQESLIERSQR